ncbi:excinuclease ABC subunit UvrC [Candidatus Daviesbacteria bacterium]|nr:excinuclease ABC subunit UvrC [Candidatus Daviesbacteria bacterium]
MIPNFIDKDQIPHKPGVYIFKDFNKRVIYVGKAIDLYSRVSSYFFSSPSNLKTQVLVSKIKSLETVLVESELEALILEANLIKKYLPEYNIRLTDDKDYLYIKITKESYPRIITARKQDLKNSLKYFGPFPSSKTVKNSLRDLRKVFPWCSNPPGPRNKKNKACFYFHLNLCKGACVGKITQTEYRQTIKLFIKFMEGKKAELINELAEKMLQEANNLDFEKAEAFKKILSGIQYITQPNKLSAYLENPNFLSQQNLQALTFLQKDLKLNALPERIEGYDISNIQGVDATGSMVVLTHGEVDKSEYRKFKIKISGKPNDVGMHQEMMQRRLKHSEWKLPDLIIIDGGRGQVKAAYEQLQKRNLNIPIFGLAKRLEWLYPPDGEIIKLPKRSLALRLLQKIRDEAHRFAINYHRKLHLKSFGIDRKVSSRL